MELVMELFSLTLPLAYLWLPFVLVATTFYFGSSAEARKPSTPGPRAPPGPWGLPLVGHLPLLGLEPHKTAMAWKAKYGPIVSVRFGSHPTLIISDYKLAKEALNLPAFFGRPQLAYAFDRSGGVEPTGIIMSQGRIWREQRTFAHKRLRELGMFGTRSMEPIIVTQIQELVQRLQNVAGHSVDTSSLFNIPILNVTWSIVSGAPFDHDNPEVGKVIKVVTEAFGRVDFMTMLIMFMPWIGRWFPASWTKLGLVERTYKPLMDFFPGHIETHRQPPCAGEDGQPQTFIEAYMQEVETYTGGDPNSSFHPSNANKSLMTTLTDLFVGATETTTSALSWIGVLLAKYPDVQAKVAAEILQVIGAAQLPSLANRVLTPYTNAFLHEVFRFRPLLPLGAYRSALEDTVFGGYAVQKGTIIFTNVYECHFNEERWDGDPRVFRPERWLDEDGEFVEREGLLVFGGGKRVCPGEQMAKDEMYLFTAGLVQAFVIEADEKLGASLEPKLDATTHGPKAANLVFTICE